MKTVNFPTENKLKKTKKETIIKFLKEEVEPAYADLVLDDSIVVQRSQDLLNLEDELAVLKAENQALKKEIEYLNEETRKVRLIAQKAQLSLQSYRDKANVLEFNAITLEGSNFWTKVKVLFSRNGVTDYFNGETIVKVSKC